jgi:hypothetical protein
MKLRFGQEAFSRECVKFLALVAPFGGFYVGGSAITVFELLAPLLLWFTLRGSRAMPAFALLYIGYCALSLVSAGVVLAEAGAGFSVRTFVAALRQFLLFTPFILIFGIRDFDLALARETNTRFLIGGAITVVGGLVLHLLGIQVQDNQQVLWLGRGMDPVLRAGGLVGNSGSFGLQVALWFGAWFLMRPALGQKMPLGASALVLIGTAAAVYFSASRGGLLQIVSMLAIGMISSAVRLRAGVALTMLAGGTVATFVFMAGLVRIDTGTIGFTQLARLDFLNVTGQVEVSDSGRLQLFTYFLDIIRENVVMGIGYKMTVPKYGVPLDNAFLLAFLETGVIAGTLFTLFWAALLVFFANRALRESWFAPIGLALAGSFALRLMVMGAHTAWNAAPSFFILIAMLIRLTEQRSRLLRDARRSSLSPAA